MVKLGWVGAMVAAAVASSGCGGAAASAPTPGHGTPAAAVAGLIQGLAAHDLQTACGFVEPATQATCRSSAIPSVSGVVRLGHTAVDGDEALVVAISTRYCVQGQCFSNGNPYNGLPVGSTTFAQAYASAQKNSANPATPCKKVGGVWYVAG